VAQADATPTACSGAQMAQFFHIYMPRAAAATDPVERMKNVVSAFVAAMPLTSGNFLKPLNPLLGETLQTEYSDGTRLWMEQTCHHPPVAGFYVEGAGKEYTASGFLQFSVGFGYNKMLVTPQGERTVHFKDGTAITCDCPRSRSPLLYARVQRLRHARTRTRVRLQRTEKAG